MVARLGPVNILGNSLQKTQNFENGLYACYTDILYPSVVVLWLAIVLFYCAIWSLDHQVE